MTKMLTDPTQNVIFMITQASKRQDDLREAEARRIDDKVKNIEDYQKVIIQHFKELMGAEAKRVNAIREVDTLAIGIASEKADAQAKVLANNVETSAKTLRELVDTTNKQLIDRITLLEKNQSEKKGSGTGMRDMRGWIVGGVMLLIAISSTIINYMK